MHTFGAAQLGVKLLRVYKRWLSPLLPPACRFTPTCSEYMAEAMAVWGFWRGLGMGLRRLARCHPWQPGGYDPVPRQGGKGG
ncbi:MAG: membrane protein insertion efficiency factor YidD [Thermoanaerobaculum sp.]|nr:membrane protein insertion efficiency factor YidD [Thermoanaerobaculum sp.]